MPWAGCQYVRELENTMREAQQQSLEATAIAIASTLKSDDDSVRRLRKFADSNVNDSIYLHPLPSESIILDGYGDEWKSLDKQPQQLKDTVSLVYGGLSDKRFWLFLQIPQNKISYYHPGAPLSEAERIRLSARDDAGNIGDYELVASGPGAAEVFLIKEDGVQREYQIKAHWIESAAGYQVELSGAFSLVSNGLSVSRLGAGEDASLEPVSIPAPGRISPALELKLAPFSDTKMRLELASTNGNLIGKLGTTEDKFARQTPWLISKLFELIRSNQDSFTKLDPPSRSGKLDSRFSTRNQRLLEIDGQRLMQVRAPIELENTELGHILVSQGLAELRDTADSAVLKLILYSSIVTILATLLLAAYATWLSLRIQHLNHKTKTAIASNGVIDQGYVSSRMKDEIGELSRNFGSLLKQVGEYTDYLKTLSNKLSHELRTPLAIVSSSLDNLEHENLDENIKIYARRAKEGSNRLSTILNSMSAASRVEQAVLQVEFEQLQIDDFLIEITEAYKDIYPSHQFLCSITGDKQHLCLSAAPELLAQMLDKLIDNAVDFSPDNAAIHFTLSADSQNIVLSVANPGPSLPEGMERYLFDSLVSVRNENKSSTDKAHLGLGLYIVKLIVACHGGNIRAQNQPETGVVFEIKLPR